MDDRLALTLVTGFLGSGKTTLIRRFVETDGGADTGIVVKIQWRVRTDSWLKGQDHVDNEALDEAIRGASTRGGLNTEVRILSGAPFLHHSCCASSRGPRCYIFGSMFWFRRNRLDGSNRAFSRASRLYFASP